MMTAPSQKEILGKAIRDLRARSGLSQDKLAELAMVKREYVSSLEQDRVERASIDKLERLAAVLNVHPHVLLRAAGYRVSEPPPVKPRTLSDILTEAAVRAKELEERNDDEARCELRQVVDFFARPLVLA